MQLEGAGSPMETLTITKAQARRFMLAHQGLWPPYSLSGKTGVLDYIRRVGCIQFDPLNIAGRNADLVLQARVARFRPAMLRELLYEDRELLDGWDKNMSIYGLEDWPYFERRREAARRSPRRTAEAIQAILPTVREAIKERGPLSSLDLDFNQTIDWSWAPTRLARAALESMYTWGELIIHHKVNTRKVYDFAEHHIPPHLLTRADPNPSKAEFHDWYVLRRMGGIGLVWDKAGDAWLGMYDIKSPERKAAISRLLEQGKVAEVRVSGVPAPFFIRSEDMPGLAGILETDPPRPRAAILAPLDNLLWDRRLVKELFDFEYIWEVYKPVAERRYGYYVLPILYGDRFVTRFEPVRDRTNGSLVIRNWWWEEGVKQSARMRAELRRCVKRFMKFLDLNHLRIDKQSIKRERLDWLIV
jgi:uncharacterized protein YcaQ